MSEVPFKPCILDYGIVCLLSRTTIRLWFTEAPPEDTTLLSMLVSAYCEPFERLLFLRCVEIYSCNKGVYCCSLFTANSIS